LKNEKGKMKNVNSTGRKISIMNFAIYTLPFVPLKAGKFALFQRAKLLSHFGLDIAGRKFNLPHRESLPEGLTS
jgi:hypothetical protein